MLGRHISTVIIIIIIIIPIFCRSRLSNLPRIGAMNSTEPIIGFQVDRVKHSELGEGKVRLTAYYVSTGKVRGLCVYVCVCVSLCVYVCGSFSKAVYH